MQARKGHYYENFHSANIKQPEIIKKGICSQPQPALQREQKGKLWQCTGEAARMLSSPAAPETTHSLLRVPAVSHKGSLG